MSVGEDGLKPRAPLGWEGGLAGRANGASAKGKSSKNYTQTCHTIRQFRISAYGGEAMTGSG